MTESQTAGPTSYDVSVAQASAADAGGEQDEDERQGDQAAGPQPGTGSGALLGDEVGQAVREEPGLDAGVVPRHARRSRARRTSSCMVSMRASMPSNFTIPRSRSTKATSTSTP